MGDFDAMTPQAIGQRIKALRAAEGLTPSEFARRAGLGQKALNNWESGRQRPSIELASLICKAYRVDLDWLLLGDGRDLRNEVVVKLSRIGHAVQPTE